jgi:hypothetical protein
MLSPVGAHFRVKDAVLHRRKSMLRRFVERKENFARHLATSFGYPKAGSGAILGI